MPIYEYQCAKCKRVFEKIRSISNSDDPVKCEHCKNMNSKRILSSFFTSGADKPESSSISSCNSCSGGNCSTCH